MLFSRAGVEENLNKEKIQVVSHGHGTLGKLFLFEWINPRNPCCLLIKHLNW